MLSQTPQRATKPDVLVRRCGAPDVLALARLHIENLSNRIDSRLVEIYYRSLVQGQQNFCVCAEANGSIVGYLGVIASRKQIIKSLVSSSCLTELGLALLHPSVMLGILRKSTWALGPLLREEHSDALRCEYRPVVVSKDYRNQGIAQRLIAAAEEILTKTGIAEAFLFVHSPNSSALSAYRRSGFQFVGREGSATTAMRKRFGRQETIPSAQRPLAAEGCPMCSGFAQRNLAKYRDKFLKRCLHCGGSYVVPQPSPEELVAHFQDDHADKADLESKFELNRENVLSRVADYIQRSRQRGRILDVGCATGLFLSRFFQKPNWDTWGLELTPSAAEQATTKGVRVFRGDIHQAQFAENSFDVITVLDAFYYFPDPAQALAEFRRVLMPDGLLVLELPFAASRIWRTSTSVGRLLSGSRHPLLESSDHLFYFTPKSVACLLTRCGFRIQAILPLPANRQAHLLRDLAFRAYSLGSSLACSASGARIFLGPRFLVAASKTSQPPTAGSV